MRRVLRLIHKHGVGGAIRVICNAIVYYVCRLLPIDKNLIVLESDGDLCDNAYALFDYFREHNYLKKYHVVWLVYSLSNKEKIYNVTYVNKQFTSFGLKKNLYLATCKWYIFDHINVYEKLNRRQGTCIVNLCHGTTFKGYKDHERTNKEIVDILIAPSEFWIKFTADFYMGSIDKVKPLGYPRNDYFFKKHNRRIKEYIAEKKWGNYSKVIFWMPTFRKSTIEKLSENYFNNETGLPLLVKSDDLEQCNSWLKELNVLIVFKVHHLQADCDGFNNDYSNIQIIKDDEINHFGLQLYQLVACSDALITDYSSISNDYLLIDRPIIYTMDDYDEYRKSRGFLIDDPAQYFAGYHVFNVMELHEAIEDIANNIDKYKEERKKLLTLMHKYCDGNSSERIVKYLHI